MDVGPHRDIVGEYFVQLLKFSLFISILGELSSAIRKRTSLKFGLYYSLFEWFNRLYLDDQLHLFFQQNYVNFKMWPELKEVISKYKPEVLW